MTLLIKLICLSSGPRFHPLGTSYLRFFQCFAVSYWVYLKLLVDLGLGTLELKTLFHLWLRLVFDIEVRIFPDCFTLCLLIVRLRSYRLILLWASISTFWFMFLLIYHSIWVLIVLHQPVVLLIDDVICFPLSIHMCLFILGMSHFQTLTYWSSDVEVAHIFYL